MGRRLPVVDGVREVDGASAPVTIRRDRHHVPHVDAATAADAWFGLGFATGQDRAWQLTSYQRVVRGTLAALVGPDGVPIDRFSRRIGFDHRAGRVLAAQDERTRAELEAYARGVTAGATVGVGVRPHELALLQAEFEEFTSRDVVGVMLLFAFSLAANWDAELSRLRVLLEDGPEALAAVTPRLAAHLPVTHPPGSATGEVLDRLAADLDLLGEHVPLGGASNNWVVSGARTRSGSPLLANDPHLTPAVPAYWYLAHVSTPDWSVAGASLVGAPSIVAGHNGHGAWGVTAGRTDAVDLFLEQVDGTRLRDDGAPGGWVEGEVRREVIEVRNFPPVPGRRPEPVVEEVLEGPRGPIVGPTMDGAPDALSMSATWWDEAPVRGFMDLVTAREFADVRAAFGRFPIHLNVVWADADGGIGWQLVGTLPRRRAGNGSVPLPGWLPEVGWHDEHVHGDELPWAADPEGGWLATANNAPIADAAEAAADAAGGSVAGASAGEVEGGPPAAGAGRVELGVDFADAYRVAAIGRALDARDDWDVEAFLDLQRDDHSLPWLELREHLLGVDPDGDPDVLLAQQLLADWDGRVRAGATAASVYELALAALAVALVGHRAPRSAAEMLGRSWTPLAAHGFMALQRTAHVSWVLRERPGGWGDLDAHVRTALGDAVRRLRRDHGPSAGGWAWGQVRRARLRHPLAESVPGLAAVFDVPVPTAGDTHTISPQTVVPTDPLGNPLALANLRLVVDLADVEASRWSLAGGQSGNPCSPHYDDLVRPWLGGGIAIPFAPERVAAATRHTLRLVPGAP